MIDRDRDDTVTPTECPTCHKPYVHISGIFRPARTCKCPTEADRLKEIWERAEKFWHSDASKDLDEIETCAAFAQSEREAAERETRLECAKIALNHPQDHAEQDKIRSAPQILRALRESIAVEIRKHIAQPAAQQTEDEVCDQYGFGKQEERRDG